MEVARPNCPECGGIFEFDSGAGGEVCTNCGIMSKGNDIEYEVLGRVLEGEEDEFGRNYLRADSNTFTSGTGRNRAGRLIGKTNATIRHDYHQDRITQSERHIRSLLAHFNLSDLYQRTRVLFRQAKVKMDFRWGDKAMVIAAACVYIVSRERERGLPLVDLAYIAEIEYSTLARAQNKVKSVLDIRTKELDPIVYLDRLMLYIIKVLNSAPDPILSGNPKKTKWTPANLEWLRSLKMQEVRSLATGLLAFTAELDLAAGRLPEQVACAVVLSAMEGVGRKPSPFAGEILQELGHLIGCKSATIAERYRELSRALSDYAPTVPWIGEKGRNCNKRDLAKWTEDIVKFRKSKMAKLTLEKQRLVLVDDEAFLEGEDLEGENADQSSRSPIASTSKLNSSNNNNDDENEGAEDEPGGASAAFPDPFNNNNEEAVQSLSDFIHKTEANARRIATPLTIPSDNNSLISPCIQEIAPPLKSKRPSEYMKPKPHSVKRSRTTSELLNSNSLISTPSPSASTLPDSSTSTPTRSRSYDSESNELLINSNSKGKPLLTHSTETSKLRKLLSSGLEIDNISQKVGIGLFMEDDAVLGGPLNRRLSTLLWTKTAEEITDEELFDKGELESFVRSEEEIQLLKRTDKFVTMPLQKPYVEPKVRSSTYKKKVSTSGKKKVKKMKPNSGVEGAAEVEEEEEEESFKYVRRSKADSTAMEQMAAFFAEGREEGEDNELGMAFDRVDRMAGEELDAVEEGLITEED